MAMTLATNADGIVTEGKWAGYKLTDVMDYYEKLEAIADGEPTPTPPAKPSGAPASPLAEHSAERTSGLATQLALRAEQDDEEAFAATQPLYDQKIPGRDVTFREAVSFLKQKLTPEMKSQRGIHNQLFNMVVQQTPEYQEKIRKALQPDPPPAALPAGEEEEQLPTPDPTPAAAPAPAPRTPKAAPPASAPTPASRQAAPPAAGQKKSKLVGNERVEKFCRQFQLDVNKYLLELEEKGWTQERLDSFQKPGGRSLAATRGGGKSVFDHTDD
jgi:hypothetical protein